MGKLLHSLALVKRSCNIDLPVVGQSGSLHLIVLRVVKRQARQRLLWEWSSLCERTHAHYSSAYEASDGAIS